MIDHACPRCNGAMWVESFKAEGKTYIEITCLLCARVWPVRLIEQILAPLRERGYNSQVRRLKAEVNNEISHIRGSIVL